MKKKLFILPLLTSAGALLLSTVNISSAQAAFSVKMNGRTTPDGRAKVDMTFDSEEVGRRLDTSYFYRTQNAGRGLNGDLKGSLFLTVTTLTDSLLSFDVKVTNQTDSDFKAAIVSLWLGIAETVNGVEIVEDGEVFRRSQKIANVPGPDNGSGVCFSVSGCGANKTAVHKGLLDLSDSFKVNIAGDFGEAGSGFGTVTLTDSGTRWKVRRAGTYNVAGVPEPITMLGSGAALAFGALMKRRVDKKKES